MELPTEFYLHHYLGREVHEDKGGKVMIVNKHEVVYF